MGVPNATRLAASTAVSGLGDWISVHTAAAGTTGASEATGGGYARKQTVWSDATTNRNGTTVNISVAAGTYVEGGVWSAVTAGTFRGSAAFAAGNVVVSGTGASIDVTPSVTA